MQTGNFETTFSTPSPGGERDYPIPKVKIWVTFTAAEIRALQELSQTHYDFTCRLASKECRASAPGSGFLWPLIQSIEAGAPEAMALWGTYNFDLCAKLTEQARWLPEYMQGIGYDLYEALRGALQSIVRECTRLNDPDKAGPPAPSYVTLYREGDPLRVLPDTFRAAVDFDKGTLTAEGKVVSVPADELRVYHAAKTRWERGCGRLPGDEGACRSDRDICREFEDKYLKGALL